MKLAVIERAAERVQTEARRRRANEPFVPAPAGREQELLDSEAKLLRRLVELKVVVAQRSAVEGDVNALLGREFDDSAEFDYNAAERELAHVERQLAAHDGAISALVEERERQADEFRLAKLREIEAEYRLVATKIAQCAHDLSGWVYRARELQLRHFDLDMTAVYGPKLPGLNPHPELPAGMYKRN